MRPAHRGRRLRSPIRTDTGREKDAVAPRPPSVAASQATATPRTGLVADVEALQQQSELFTKRIEMEKRRSEELDKKLTISRKKLEESRERLRGMNDVSAMRHRTRMLRVSENRLETTLARLNQQRTANSHLKKDVESLRRDKLQRQAILTRLRQELTDAESLASRAGQDQREASEMRDAVHREIQNLHAQFQQELEEFEHAFDERIGAVAATTQPAKLEAIDHSAAKGESAALLLHFGSADAHHGALSIAQERELKHKSTKSYWDIARREVELREQEHTLAQLEEAFAQIQEGTHIQTIDEMVSAFVAAEDRHFALINMINDIGKEIEEVEVEIKTLREQVEQVRDRSRLTEREHQGQFGGLETEIEALQRKGAVFDRRYDKLLHHLDTIRPGIHSLFQKLGATDEAAVESLAATGVTETNLLEFLGVIEQRVNEIVQLQDAAANDLLTHEVDGEGASPWGRDKLVPAGEFASRVGGLGGGEGAPQFHQSVRSPPLPPAVEDMGGAEEGEEGEEQPVATGPWGTTRRSVVRSASAGPPGLPTTPVARGGSHSVARIAQPGERVQTAAAAAATSLSEEEGATPVRSSVKPLDVRRLQAQLYAQAGGGHAAVTHSTPARSPLQRR